MEITQFAPVLIPTLSRYEHFKRCVESLAKCTHAEKTDLFIALDYPSKEEHWEGYIQICSFIETINGFGSVVIIRREINYGPYENYTDALTQIFKTYDILILSEDDNFFSRDFLNFVNQGLEIYKNRADIFSVSGYNYPIKQRINETEHGFLWQGYSAWGVGLWKNKWNEIHWDKLKQEDDIKSFLKSPYQVYKHFRIANHYIPNKLRMIRENGIFGDVYITYYLFKNSMYSIFPTQSRVRNMGHDGSGVHCGDIKNNPFINQTLYEGSSNYTLDPNVSINDYYNREIYYFTRLNFKQRTSTFIHWLHFIKKEATYKVIYIIKKHLSKNE